LETPFSSESDLIGLRHRPFAALFSVENGLHYNYFAIIDTLR